MANECEAYMLSMETLTSPVSRLACEPAVSEC